MRAVRGLNEVKRFWPHQVIFVLQIMNKPTCVIDFVIPHQDIQESSDVAAICGKCLKRTNHKRVKMGCARPGMPSVDLTGGSNP